jgi:hypothetical protein
VGIFQGGVFWIPMVDSTLPSLTNDAPKNSRPTRVSYAHKLKRRRGNHGDITASQQRHERFENSPVQQFTNKN